MHVFDKNLMLMKRPNDCPSSTRLNAYFYLADLGNGTNMRECRVCACHCHKAMSHRQDVCKYLCLNIFVDYTFNSTQIELFFELY